MATVKPWIVEEQQRDVELHVRLLMTWQSVRRASLCGPHVLVSAMPLTALWA